AARVPRAAGGRAGGGGGAGDRGKPRVIWLAERVEAAAVAHEPVDQPAVHRRPTEPQHGPAGPERLRLQPDRAEPVVAAVKRQRGARPGPRPHLELLVGDVAPAGRPGP